MVPTILREDANYNIPRYLETQSVCCRALFEKNDNVKVSLHCVRLRSQGGQAKEGTETMGWGVNQKTNQDPSSTSHFSEGSSTRLP